MADRYLVHLGDGTEYGPVDRATLVSWRAEGRLPEGTLVWPDGAPAWLAIEDVLASRSAAAAPAAAPRDDGTDTRPRMRPPGLSRPRQAPGPTRGLRILLWGGAALALAAVALGGLWTVLRPYVARRWAVASIQRQALPERRIEDGETGLVAELPAGWLALRPGNPFLPAPEARLRLAQPAIGAFATLVVAGRPRSMDALDAHLDELLQERLPRRPSLRQQGRADVQLGRGRGRAVRTAFADGRASMQGATVAWADGYDVFSLDAWAPAEAGAEFAAQVEALCRGLRTTGLVEGRLGQAVDRLALEVPELSQDTLRLLVSERMSQGKELEGVPSTALFMVSRGLDALTPGEAEEMRAIYQQVWAPVPDADRVRMASLLQEIRAGRDVLAADLLALRGAVKAGVLALPPEQRTRLQQLSGRAVRRAFQRP